MDGLKDTIVGIATPAGYGGISILKISGSQSIPILNRLFRNNSTGDQSPKMPAPARRLLHGYIGDPVTGDIVDEVLVSVMEGPRSYTREDVVEINIHGGPVLTAKVLRLIVQEGGRIAEPGEFTKRAFLNGRIDLTQAEAVADLINAKSESGVKAFSHMAQGALGSTVRKIKERLVDILAEIEGSIDFYEEIEAVADGLKIADRVEIELRRPLEGILKRFDEGRVLREGLRVTIIGRPNVGKSTLLNSLVGSERAIVTSIPGTTRDLLEETVNIGGVPVVLTDTAGWHESQDLIEKIGIQKSRESVREADLIILMVDGSQPGLPFDLKDVELLDDKRTLVVANKMDLVPSEPEWVEKRFSRFSRLKLSAKFGQGMEDLIEWISAKSMDGTAKRVKEDRVLPNARQKQTIDEALAALKRAESGCREKAVTLELTAEDLKSALGALERTLGERCSTDILDQVFSRFCIGK